MPSLNNTVEKLKHSSWKTTTSSIIVVIIAGLGLLNKILSGEPITTEEITIFIGLLGTSFGLFSARDNNKSSEDVHIKDNKGKE